MLPPTRRSTRLFSRARRDLLQTPARPANISEWLDRHDPFPPSTPSTALVPLPVNRILRFEDILEHQGAQGGVEEQPEAPEVAENVQEIPRKRILVTHKDREKIRCLHFIAGWSVRKIAWHFNRPISTIGSILELPNTTPPRRRPTTICVMDTPTRKRAVQLATSSAEGRRMPFSALKIEMGLQCSDSTFARGMHKEGYYRIVGVVAPFVNDKNKEKRYTYGLLLEYHTAEMFFNFVWTDEAFYIVGKPRFGRRVTRRRGEMERLLPECLHPRLTSKRVGVHYWICFTARAKGPLFIWDRNTMGNYTALGY